MEKPKRHRTTLYFPPELWKRVKIRAIQEGIDATDLVVAAVEQYFKKGGAR